MPSNGLRRRPSAVAATALLVAGLAGCGDSEDAGEGSAAAPQGLTASTVTASDPPTRRPGKASPNAEIEPPPCPAELAGCVMASGTILYVERVDPDGDGDAHFVLLSRDGITAPGISTIDVRPDLRPDPLPGPGDLLAATGPVFEGSFGQRQIQAEAVEFERLP